MEVILYLIGIYGVIALIGWLFDKTSELFEKRREKIRDQVAEEILHGLNIEMVIDSYKNKLTHIKYLKTDPTHIEIEKLKEQLWGSNAVLMNECPKCKEGNLMVRKGQYGKFLGCTKYPKCDYTQSITEARGKYKKSVNEQIINDIQRAYQHI